ncbi:MAG: MiaB/RimO family radical SAM methylthiotransferase [Ruminococcus sp.]|nr:MiaB/RimO family radical SAM methylthiotransferase [Ruminococcus sp.]
MELNYMEKLKGTFSGRNIKAYVHSFGCQLNVSDGEKIKGILKEIGFSFTDNPENAGIIILNTCAVRESAEERVFGIIGSMKKLKSENPDLIIGVSGCMTAQEKNLERIKKSYPQVDIVLGTSAINSLPRLIYEHLQNKNLAYDISEYADFSCNAEQVRESSFKASVPIMFGCNNFCTYCIVPYVRGRERSRNADDIINEVTELVNNGYKEIMLLGQNVNSYGKDLENGLTFPQLLRELNEIQGDFIIRFMSSHPKDATRELLDTILECDKVAKHLHLPVQSGNNNILKAMNRNYTVENILKR